MKQIQDELTQVQARCWELNAENKALFTDKKQLVEEVNTWKSRTNQLIEKYNIINLEDFKKLT